MHFRGCFQLYHYTPGTPSSPGSDLLLFIELIDSYSSSWW